MYVRMDDWMYVCMYACIYVCMHVHIHIQIHTYEKAIYTVFVESLLLLLIKALEKNICTYIYIYIYVYCIYM